MPRVSEEYRAAKRLEIVEAALRAFRRRGFQGTSMPDILSEAGMSAGAVYSYFDSKGEIIRAVAKHVVSGRVEDIERLITQDPLPAPHEVVAAVMHGMMRELDNPAILVQMWGEAVTDPELRVIATRVFSRMRHSYGRYISAWHQRSNGLDANEAERLAEEQVPLFISASQGFIVQQALFTDFDAEHYLTTALSHLPR